MKKFQAFPLMDVHGEERGRNPMHSVLGISSRPDAVRANASKRVRPAVRGFLRAQRGRKYARALASEAMNTFFRNIRVLRFCSES